MKLRLRRVIAGAIVCGSACGAFDAQLTSETTEEVAVVNVDNPFIFTTSMQSHPFTITVQNQTDSDDVTSITAQNPSACQNFMLSPVALPAHICGGLASFAPGSNTVGCPQNLLITITYVGNSNESCNYNINWIHTGSITGSGSGAGSGVEVLQLSSSISAPSMTVSPATVDFGQLGILTTSTPPKQVTVTNNGNVPITVMGMLTGTGAGAYTVTAIGSASLAAHTLGPGLQDVYNVTCTPPLVQTYAASLGFTATPGPISKSSTFSCEGIMSTITINPTQVTFPSTLVGRPPMDQTVHVSGPANATLDSVMLDAMATQNDVVIMGQPTTGQVLGVGGLNIVLHYKAITAFDSGPLGKLMIKASSDAMVRSVGISGEALPGSIGTNPATVELGPVCAMGSGSLDVEVFANAAGTVALNMPSQPAAPFAFTTTNLVFPVTLKGNHVGTSAILKVTANPTAVGDATGTLTLPTDIPSAPTYDLPLHATVLATGIGTTPEQIHFGTIDPDTSTSVREVKLTNCGTTDLVVTGARIVGANQSEFVLVEPTEPATTLKPTESETFRIIMSAHSNGNKVASLRVEHDATSNDVPLDGTVGGNTDRQTYYGCSVGGGAGAWPIGLVVLALRRRRAAR